MHTGKQQPSNDLQIQRLPQVSITHYPSPGFLSLKVPSLRAGWCERSSSCLRWRRRKIAQGDTCLPSSFSQCFWHRQQHFTLWNNGAGKNIFTIFIPSGRFHIGLPSFFYRLAAINYSAGRYKGDIMEEEPLPFWQVGTMSLFCSCWQVWPPTLLPNTYSEACEECSCQLPSNSIRGPRIKPFIWK